MKNKNLLALLISIVVAQLAGVIGSFFTTPNIPTWYNQLNKPDIAPPNWVFAPVWTTLFLLMGIAAFLIWKKGWSNKNVKIALAIYVVQLLLNMYWSILFFGLQSPAAAFFEIIILWLAILGTILTFGRVSRAAAWLMIPYILWVSFAAVLNFQIWNLNKENPTQTSIDQTPIIIEGEDDARYFGNEARADFNSDGVEDRAFLMVREPGGSGTFYYLVALISDGKKFVGTNAILIGDRIAPQTTEYRDGQIIVNYADRAPGEPFTTQPSVAVSGYFKFENNTLVEASL